MDSNFEKNNDEISKKFSLWEDAHFIENKSDQLNNSIGDLIRVLRGKYRYVREDVFNSYNWIKKYGRLSDLAQLY